MGFWSKLFGLDEMSSHNEEEEDYHLVDYMPTISKGGSIVRGVDTCSFVFPKHEKFEGCIILIWQPKRHSFTHYIHSEKMKITDKTEDTGEKFFGVDIIADNGHMSFDAGQFRHRDVEATGEFIVDWIPAQDYALEDHNVKLISIIDGEFLTKVGTVTILNAPMTLDHDERKKDNQKVLEENLRNQVKESKPL